MLVHRRVTPSITFAATHLYTGVERGTVRVKCLVQEHNTMSPSRAQTWTATPPPLVKLNCSYSVMDALLPKSANWHITSYLCEYFINFYEFLPQKLSCEDLLIEVIKLWPPPIRHGWPPPQIFSSFFRCKWYTNKTCFTWSYALTVAKQAIV